MRRADTTDEAYQVAWRGTHNLPADGLWEYPDPRRKERKKGSRYLRCNCGWRLIEIAKSQAARGEAHYLHAEHVRHIRHERGIVGLRRDA